MFKHKKLQITLKLQANSMDNWHSGQTQIFCSGLAQLLPTQGRHQRGQRAQIQIKSRKGKLQGQHAQPGNHQAAQNFFPAEQWLLQAGHGAQRTPQIGKRGPFQGLYQQRRWRRKWRLDSPVDPGKESEKEKCHHPDTAHDAALRSAQTARGRAARVIDT